LLGRSSHDTTDRWRRVTVAGVELEVPAELAPASEAALDGPAASFEAPGLRLLLDSSPFADPLTGYESRPEFARMEEQIGGVPAKIVSFRSDDGTRVIAARLPGLLTAVAHVAPDGDPELALRILRSIRPTITEE
jgi:hypothetical protein